MSTEAKLGLLHIQFIISWVRVDLHTATKRQTTRINPSVVRGYLSNTTAINYLYPYNYSTKGERDTGWKEWKREAQKTGSLPVYVDSQVRNTAPLIVSSARYLVYTIKDHISACSRSRASDCNWVVVAVIKVALFLNADRNSSNHSARGLHTYPDRLGAVPSITGFDRNLACALASGDGKAIGYFPSVDTTRALVWKR